MRYALSGGCHCGNIGLELELPREPGSYHPRACDCDFCRRHGAAYLSDPQGTLLIRIKDAEQSGSYRQGSGQAEFLICRNCGVLTAVLYRNEGRLYGAVNARAVGAGADFGAEQPISPKTLSAGDKARRWQDLWIPDVRLIAGG